MNQFDNREGEKENEKILGAIAALAMTVGLAACGTPVSQGTANQNQLVVGMEAGYPPLTGLKKMTQTVL